ncbi:MULTISPECIES: hypothetical protein [Myroides]|uniref:Competence protein n=1 Tax=Myroides albus TaxID=2562892 RepID=A0A6I3LK70_9FLAO|nr:MULTISPECIES: hypothetical protein [Myroides]MTG96542.1 hypothetical protein [Myroides albus]MVX34538.1 hypothetical protein [Myroides sp. LoEW2-1]UVD81044.1 hypothetical protein NWE55_07295 [Myroides albus]
MAFDEVKSEMTNIKENSEEFIKSTLDYYRLWGFKVSVKAGSIFMTLILVSLFSTLALLFISLFAAYAIGEAFNSTSTGFLIVGSFYILVSIIAYSFRKSLVERPLIKKLSEILFND